MAKIFIMSEYEKALKQRLKRDTLIGIGIVSVILLAYLAVVFFM